MRIVDISDARQLKATQAILVGLGKRSRINADGYRKAAGDVAK
ncbi:hypothetical protein EBR57_07710, partial [bacterium]|nr:hypothetical protein [bacterium]